MSFTYVTTDELSSLIKYDPRTIRERLKDSVLLEGVHYIRPFGGRAFLKFVFWLEGVFPKFFAENGQYPLIVVKK